MSHRLDFIAFPKGEVSLSYLLKPNVSLYCVDMKEAVFVEVPEHIDIYSPETDPFLMVAQYKNAVRIVTLPLDVMMRYAETVEAPKVPVLLVSHVGRCGSTLLGQLIQASAKNGVLLSEPDTAIDLFHLRHNKKMCEERYTRLVAACFKMLCKVHQQGHDLICIKGFSATTSEVAFIHRACPHIKLLFLYRLNTNASQSYERMLRNRPTTLFWWRVLHSKILLKLAPTDWWQERSLLNFFHTERESVLWANDIDFCASLSRKAFFFLRYCVICYEYRMLRNVDKVPIAAVRYEDVVENLEVTCGLLKEYLGLKMTSAEMFSRAKEVLGKDSQRGSTLSARPEGKRVEYNTELKDEEMAEMCSIAKRLDLPEPGVMEVLEGTLRAE